MIQHQPTTTAAIAGGSEWNGSLLVGLKSSTCYMTSSTLSPVMAGRILYWFWVDCGGGYDSGYCNVLPGVYPCMGRLTCGGCDDGIPWMIVVGCCMSTVAWKLYT